MRLNRFIGNFDLERSNLLVQNKDLENQLFRVLRLNRNDKVILSDGSGFESEATIISHKGGIIEFSIGKKKKGTLDPERNVHLYPAITKRDTFEWLVQKASECGVRSITPTLTEHTNKTSVSLPRLEKIALEAAEQSGKTFVTKINTPANLTDSVRLAGGKKIICQFEGYNFESIDKNSDSKEISIFIGPEGGFSEKELALAENSSTLKLSLGKQIFRAETAAIIASYLFTK